MRREKAKIAESKQAIKRNCFMLKNVFMKANFLSLLCLSNVAAITTAEMMPLNPK